MVFSAVVNAGLDPSIAVIAGPVEFKAVLKDESSVELSWNSQLIDGSEVSYFKIRNGNSPIAQTSHSSWLVENIDRDISYDFSVSAVTANGFETRRSNRIYFDLPQLSEDAPDGFNAYLPPLENVRAIKTDTGTVELSWSSPRSFWSWAVPEEYSYLISTFAMGVATVDDLKYTLDITDYEGKFWVAVEARLDNRLVSRQPTLVLIDTESEAGTVTKGYPGFDSISGLNVAVYSSTAAELFWEKHHFPTTSLIYLNGRLIERQHEGNSLYLDNFAPGSRTLVSVGEGWPYDPKPPYDYLLDYDYPLMHAWVETPANEWPHGGDDIGCKVTGLKANVYSSTSAEVFWDRDTAGTQYNIILDGILVESTDATSWYSNSFVPYSKHQISVKKADEKCAQVEEAATEFILQATYSNDELSNGPGKPDNLIGLIYSQTAAEIFWETSNDGAWVVGYDIVKNGSTLAEELDVRSFFDNTLSAGGQYTYTVKAVDEDGNRSEPAAITFTMPDEQGTSLINKQNHIQIIRDVFNLYVGDIYTDPLDNIAGFSIVGRNDDFSFMDVFECETGSFEQTLDPTPTNSGTFFTFDFDRCVFDGNSHDGYVTGQDYARGLTFGTDQFSVHDSGTENYATYSGDIRKWRTQTRVFDRIHSFETDDVFIEYKDLASEFLVEQMQTSFAYGSHTSGLDEAWLRGGFTARLNRFDGPAFSASTPIEFSYKHNTRTDGGEVNGVPANEQPLTKEQRDNWTFTTGQLLIMAEDGSAVLLDADNGDPLTTLVTITSNQGIEVFEHPWSLWTEDLRFDRFVNISE